MEAQQSVVCPCSRPWLCLPVAYNRSRSKVSGQAMPF